MRARGSGRRAAKRSIISTLSTLSTSSRNRAGLTLVEVLFVMAVFAILVALVIGLGRYSDSAARIHQARADLGEWTSALGRWRDVFGEYPRPPGATNVLWLASNTVAVARFTGAAGATAYAAAGAASNTLDTAAFFRDLPLRDPWRQYYRYEAQDGLDDPAVPLFDCKLYSAGPDGKDDTPHDNIAFSN